MTTWESFAAEAPELVEAVRRCFDIRKHCTLATLRKDGSPRISGTEVEFSDGNVWLGSMPNAVKALDLRRDGRFALHSPSVDPPEEDHSRWTGEAKLAGTAVEVNDLESGGSGHRFRLDISEVVFTHLANGGLEIQSWHPGRGLSIRRR
ncbi:pyridoxamine 5'-phosphate oxidase family protein [Mumia sp. zg.B53]|uniref:pyridoxamine 5'-phosphate oxidase family protein n=1 Tax=unclassified Mumia TaxID=2621872 RepID=UPI001C6EA45D|nr:MULTISPECIES: pyridoxamine 5'-phosphate oxidase family protein [unclassified Mumia]MBW9209429.1 pyridoxamine 5'-phosphate oxidase family protein [Mumia sp. zg.B21]MBW9214034.1 pyridoxamine 5'-phosphate oxidase family protein [Mumia sp. zg.B53]